MALPIILDVDTGTDDALALLFAALHPELDLLGVSCVGGNTNLANVVDNTLRVLALAGAHDVPVAAGAARPLIEPARDASYVHGANGLADIALPEAQRTVESEGAIEFLRRRILEHPEKVTLVALAPQTNLALLLRTHPEVADNLERIVFMGGSASVGNATAVAEFNVWHDPEAAAIVLDSGVPLYMYGLDVFNHVSVPEGTAQALAVSDNPVASLAGRLLVHPIVGPDGPAQYLGWIGDAGAVCALVDPDAVGVSRLPVRVELAGYGRGATFVDRRGVPGEDSIHGTTAAAWTDIDVALEVDEDRLVRVFLDSVAPGA